MWIPKLYNGKDRTWFHFAYEGWRYRRAQQQLYNVPTDAERTGDFSNSVLRQPIFDPATTTVDPTNPQQFLRQPFAGNIIPAVRINRMTAQYLDTYYDRPVNTGVSGFNAINSRPQLSNGILCRRRSITAFRAATTFGSGGESAVSSTAR